MQAFGDFPANAVVQDTDNPSKVGEHTALTLEWISGLGWNIGIRYLVPGRRFYECEMIDCAPRPHPSIEPLGLSGENNALGLLNPKQTVQADFYFSVLSILHRHLRL